MNPNPKAYQILCYGDSNTWGEQPDSTRNRQPSNVRWAGRLQALLGNDFAVIEEGLSSRTTNLDYTDRPGRNGQTYLVPCLLSHRSLDMVILMLGTNDTKVQFDRSTKDIAKAVGELVDDIQSFATKDQPDTQLKILLVSPTHINDQAPLFEQMCGGVYDHTSVQKSQELATAQARVAEDKGCEFVDAALLVQTGPDGIHWQTEGHEGFAEALKERIKEHQ